MPIAPTMADNSDAIIAVSLNGKGEIPFRVEIPKSQKAKETLFETMFVKLKDRFSSNSYDYSMFTIFSKTIDMMQNALLQHNIALYPPDILIEIPYNVCNFYDFHKAYELIELGRLLTKKSL